MASADEKPKKSGLVPLVAVFGVITLLAVGMGWFIGSQIRQTMETKYAAAEAAAEAVAAEAQATQAKADEAAQDRAAIGKRPGQKSEKKKSSHGGEHDAPADEAHAAAGLFSSGPQIVKLDPILTNLGTKEGQWIRLEIAVVYKPGTQAASEEEKTSINETIVGMLRSKTPDDIAGPSGYLQFREDLTDAVMLGTGGRAKTAKILSMVLE